MARYRMIAARPAGSTDDEAVEAAAAILCEAGPTEVAWLADGMGLDDLTGGRPGGLEGTTLVVAGGDGTLHLVVQTLYRHGLLADAALGLIPLGTGNDLARVTGIPLDGEEAARALLRASPRPVDLLLDGDEIVVNAAHAGIGVGAAERATGLKGALGPAAYAAGAAVEGVAADPVELSLEIDGEALADGAPLLLVGVGNGSSVGGGTVLFPEADPHDGLLDVLAVADRGTWQRLVLGVAAKREDHLELEGVSYRRGREVLVRGIAAWNDDGELGDPRDGRRLHVEPGAWRLFH